MKVQPNPIFRCLQILDDTEDWLLQVQGIWVMMESETHRPNIEDTLISDGMAHPMEMGSETLQKFLKTTAGSLKYIEK